MGPASSYRHISVSLVIPVYNEEDAVTDAIDTNLRALEASVQTYEVIVVNDGSKDNTLAVVRDHIRDRPHVRLIDKQPNEGIGSAIRTGISAAQYAWVLPVPADCPLDTPTLEKFLLATEGADIVVGYRQTRVGYTLRMRLNSYVFHWLVSLLFRMRLRDYNWIHMYKRTVFTEHGVQITSRGIMMLAEVLIRSARKGLVMHEVEVKQLERITGVATASKLSTVLFTIRELIRLYRLI